MARVRYLLSRLPRLPPEWGRSELNVQRQFRYILGWHASRSLGGRLAGALTLAGLLSTSAVRLSR
jgi:hypothetical protein